MKSFPKSLIALLLFLTACTPPTTVPQPTQPPKATPELSLTTAPVEEIPVATYAVEVFAAGVGFPTAMAFAPDGRLFIAEKNGSVRYISNDGQISRPFLTLSNIDFSGERGLLGLAIDPSFAETGYFWVFYTLGDARVNRISRFTLDGEQAVDEQISFEFNIAFETSTILNGGGLHFGPDGMLYISAGTTNNIYASIEPDSPQGKIHRVDPTTFPAQPAADNPNPASTIYARGLRNTYDFTFNPATGWIYATENGGDCDDEINIIVPNGNYGWREDGLCEDMNLPADYPFERPILSFTPTIGITGIMFYTGDKFPDWQGDMFFCSWHGTKMVRIELKEDGRGIKKSERIETGVDKPCLVDLVEGPDGYIYYSDITNVYRLVPNQQ